MGCRRDPQRHGQASPCTWSPASARAARQWANGTTYTNQDPNTFPFTADAVGKTQSHGYSTIGTYRVTLRVTDDAGTKAIAQKTIIVEPRNAPTAVPGGPYVVGTWLDAGVRQGSDLVLNGQASTDPDLTCGDSITTYEWDLNGDGLYPDATGASPTVPWSTLAALLAAAGLTEAQYLADPVTGLPKVTVGLRVTDSTG